MAVLITEDWSEDGHGVSLGGADLIDCDTWEARMAARTRTRRRLAQEAAEGKGSRPPRPDRATWPVPDWVRNGSARDALLWYFMEGYRRIFGTEPEVMIDHDFGYHVISDGRWQLTFTNLEWFPTERFGATKGNGASSQ